MHVCPLQVGKDAKTDAARDRYDERKRQGEAGGRSRIEPRRKETPQTGMARRLVAGGPRCAQRWGR
jgi:hypothetical protein